MSEETMAVEVREAEAHWRQERLWVWGATLVSFIAALIYNGWTGLVVFMRDSELLADRAKHLAMAGNLNLSDLPGTILYPPLYPILISPAYFSQNPDTIFLVIQFINALLASTQVWPFYKLLSEYSQVREKYAVAVAVALTLAPFTLPYGAMVLTEVAYFGPLTWMTYFFFRYQESGELRDGLRCGAMLGLMMLCRTAAATILVAAGGALLLSVWQRRGEAGEVRKRLVVAVLMGGAFLAVYGFWKGFEKLFVTYGDIATYMDSFNFKPIFQEKKRFDHHFSWLTNTFFYYLTAPLSLAGFFFYSLTFRRMRELLRDPLYPFALLSLVVSAVVVVAVMTVDYGGPTLTWNKYLAPYVYLPILVGLRHRRRFTKEQFRASMVVLSLVILAMKPSGLWCHFNDALVLFTATSTPVPMPEAVSNMLYLLVTAVPAWLWLQGGKRPRVAAVAISAGVWGISLFGTASYYRNLVDYNMARYDGAAVQAVALARKNPQTEMYFDPKLMLKDTFGGSRVMFYWPWLVKQAEPHQLAELTKGKTNPVLYFSDREVGQNEAIAEDRGSIKLYSLNAGILSAPEPLRLDLPLAGTKPKATMGADVWPGEVVKWEGRRYSVRWLQPTSTFTIKNPGGDTEATVKLTLDVAYKPHSATLEVNGKAASEQYRISQVLWVNGPQEVTYRVRLKAGVNEFKLTSTDPPDELPGGRKVCFLLVGDIIASAN